MLEVLAIVGIISTAAYLLLRSRNETAAAVATEPSPAAPVIPEPARATAVVTGAVINNPLGAGTVPAALLPGTERGYFLEVVGESNYQEAFRELRDESDEREQSVILTPEPENPYDSNAVAVQTFQGQTLGYLKRDDAPRYQQTLLALKAEGKTAVAAARFQWGTKSKPYASVWLDVEAPTAVAAHFGVKYQRQKHTE